MSRFNGATRVGLIALGSLLGVPHVAFAQSAALSESLFEEGKRLSAEGKYAEACPKFAESYKLDPATGTLLNLGACEESLGKTATAWAHFNDALGLAKRDQVASRVAYAQDHIKSLEARLIRLVINVPADANPPGLEVKLDGEALNSAAFGVPNPIDPGHHLLDVSAPGKRPVHFEIEAVTPQATLQASVPKLEDAPLSAVPTPPAPAAPAPPLAVAAPPPGSAAPAQSTEPITAPTNALRAVGYVVAGIGVVGIGVGTVFHFEATRQNNLALATCTSGSLGNQCQSDNEYSDHNNYVTAAKSNRAVSYASLGVGVVALVTGAVLIVTGHPSEHAGASAVLPIVDRDRLGLDLSGFF
jgi:hypothetical protein